MRRRLIAVKDSQCEEFMQYGLNAGGNTMAVYTMGDNTVNNGAVTLQEQHLYGSSRLGIQKPGLEMSSLLPAYSTEVGTTTKSIYSIFERGKKFFELSNHLGNVLATVSDKKYLLAANSTGNGGCAPGSAAEDVLVSLRGTETVYTGRSSVSLLPGFESSGGDNFEVYTDAGLSACNPATDNSTATSTVYAAEVVSAQDYAPFGMELVGRQYNASSYRYGFNGKENDNEVKGEGNQYDYGFRIYDPRLGRFLSTDPLSDKFPFYTPYQFASNMPILAIDVDGLESSKIVNFIEKGQRFIGGLLDGLADNDPSKPLGQQENQFNTFNQKQIVDYKQIAKTVIKHPIKTAQNVVRHIKNDIKETGGDLSSGDAYRTGRGIGTVIRNGAEVGVPILGEEKAGAMVEKTLQKVTARTFTKGDALVLDVANSLEQASPGIVKSVEKIIKNDAGKTLTDFDIELPHLVIEVTKGSATGKAAQVLERIVPNTSNEVVLFIQGKGGKEVEKQLNKAGVKVFRDKEALIEYAKKVPEH